MTHATPVPINIILSSYNVLETIITCSHLFSYENRTDYYFDEVLIFIIFIINLFVSFF